MKKMEELIKNTAIISIGKMGTQIVNFLLLPLYTSRLTTEAYGNFDFIITVTAFIVPIITLLVEESMFRFLIDCNTDSEKKRVISHTFIFCLASMVVTSTIGFIFFTIIKYELGYMVLLYCIAMLFIALSNSLSRGLGKITLYSLSNFLSSFGIIILNIILIVGFNLGFFALLVSSVVANIASALFSFYKLKIWKFITIKYFNKKLMVDMLKYSIPLVPNSISWAIINASDRLIIMGFSGASVNGLYSIAYKFPNLINTFYNFFNIAWRETSAKIVRDNDLNCFKKIYSTIRNGLFSITILLITGLHFIYPILINSTYNESILYVPILAVSVYYMSMAAFFGGIFTAYKDTKILGTTSFVAAGINLVVNLALYKIIGVYAAAISTLIAALFLYLYRRYKTQKFIHMQYRKECYIEAGFAVVIILFYACSNVINLMAFYVCILWVCWLNRGIIRPIMAMVKQQIVKK